MSLIQISRYLKSDSILFCQMFAFNYLFIKLPNWNTFYLSSCYNWNNTSTQKVFWIFCPKLFSHSRLSFCWILLISLVKFKLLIGLGNRTLVQIDFVFVRSMMQISALFCNEKKSCKVQLTVVWETAMTSQGSVLRNTS